MVKKSLHQSEKRIRHQIIISSYHHIFEVVIPLTVVRELIFIIVIRKECWISWEVFSGKEIMMAFTQLEMAFFPIPSKSIKLYLQILFTKPSVLLKWHTVFSVSSEMDFVFIYVVIIHWSLKNKSAFIINVIKKIPSEMEVAPRHKQLTLSLFTLLRLLKLLFLLLKLFVL